MQQNCGDTEGKAEPGMGSPVQAEEESGWQNRLAIRDCDAERTKVAKQLDRLSRKAAIVYMAPVP